MQRSRDCDSVLDSPATLSFSCAHHLAHLIQPGRTRAKPDHELRGGVRAAINRSRSWQLQENCSMVDLPFMSGCRRGWFSLLEIKLSLEQTNFKGRGSGSSSRGALGEHPSAAACARNERSSVSRGERGEKGRPTAAAAAAWTRATPGSVRSARRRRSIALVQRSISRAVERSAQSSLSVTMRIRPRVSSWKSLASG